jgi:polar amino acid transport system permease protein
VDIEENRETICNGTLRERSLRAMIERIVECLPVLIFGLENTLSVTIISMIIATPLGLFLALMRLSKVTWLQRIVLLYVEIWRGIPFIVELLVLFFVLPLILKRWFGGITAFDTMVIGMVLWTSANSAEVFRGAIQAIPSGQTEAAMAIGMGYFQRLRIVIMPQAMKIALPPLIGIFTLVLKGTAFGFIIDYRELVRMGQYSIERLFMKGHTSASIEIYSAIMVMYFIVCYPLTQVSLYLERRLGKGSGMITHDTLY